MAEPETDFDGTVYANSEAYITLEPNTESQNAFRVPVQYSLKVGASNDAVGLDVEIDSTMAHNVGLGDQWRATFSAPDAHEGGKLAQCGTSAPNDKIQYLTASYDQSQEAVCNGYASESFGIQTEAGFIGVTWSPEPDSTNTITPTLEFYIATGTFAPSTLADMTIVSTQNQVVTLDDFDDALNCTVTRKEDGTWSIAAGKPAAPPALDQNVLLESHFLLARAHENLVSARTGASAGV